MAHQTSLPYIMLIPYVIFNRKLVSGHFIADKVVALSQVLTIKAVCIKSRNAKW